VAKSAFGKNNFDRLEAAGLVSSADDHVLRKDKLQARALALRELAVKFQKIEQGVIEAHLMEAPKQKSRLNAVLAAVQKLHASPLPMGAKRHVGVCLNELVSIREGIHSSAKNVDKKTLTMIATSAARKEILAMAASSENRMEKILAESSSTDDMEEFFKNAADVIQKHAPKAEQLKAIATKPFVIARVPVVPADGGISAERLARVGVDAESLGTYPVIKNQMVIGINPRFLLGEHSGEIKGEKAAKSIREEATRLLKRLERETKTKLQFVCDRSYSYKGGTWYWLMTDRDLDLVARVSPGNRIKISRWGFAFN